MRPTQEQADRAREALRRRMAELHWSSVDLADRAGVAYNSVNQWLTRVRTWPTLRVRGAIEDAVGWEPGALQAIAESRAGGPADQPIGAKLSDVAGQLVVRWSEAAFSGLSPEEVEEVRSAALAAGLARLREVRATARRSGDDDAAGSQPR